MRSHPWIRVTLGALAAAGALGAAICGAILIAAVISLGRSIADDSGLGAVSAGISEDALLVLLVCVAASLLLFKPAQRSSRFVARLQRAHAITLAIGFTLLVLFVVSATVSLIPASLVLVGILLIALIFAAQFLLFAALLVGLILRPRGAAAPGA